MRTSGHHRSQPDPRRIRDRPGPCQALPQILDRRRAMRRSLQQHDLWLRQRRLLPTA